MLFGNLLAISTDQLVTFGLFTLGLGVVLAIVARPLVFASVNPEVAEAKGVPVRALGVVFMVALALVITMAVQVVGTLLLFGLVVTPAAAALAITARPVMVAVLSTGIGVVCVLVGLLLAAMFNLPPSFVIVTLSFLIWLASVLVWRDHHRGDGADDHRLIPDRRRASTRSRTSAGHAEVQALQVPNRSSTWSVTLNRWRRAAPGAPG